MFPIVLSQPRRLLAFAVALLFWSSFTAAFGALLLLLLALYPFYSKLPVWRLISADYTAYQSYHKATLSEPSAVRDRIALSSIIMLVATSGLAITSRLSYEYDPKITPWFAALVDHRGLWQSVKAILWGASAYLLIVSVMRYRESYRWWGGLAGARVLAFLSFLVAGEEIDWGQTWLQFPVPDFLKAHLPDGRFNIRYLYLGGTWLVPLSWRLFQVMALLFMFVLPLFALFCLEARYILHRLGVPQVPLAFIPFAVLLLFLGNGPFVINVLGYPDGSPPWSSHNFRELIFAFIVTGTFMIERLRRAREAILK